MHLLLMKEKITKAYPNCPFNKSLLFTGLAHIFHSAFITPKTKYWCALAQDAEGNEYVPYTDYSSVQEIPFENGTSYTK